MRIKPDPKQIEIIENPDGIFKYYLRRGNKFFFMTFVNDLQSKWVIEFTHNKALDLIKKLKHGFMYEIVLRDVIEI